MAEPSGTASPKPRAFGASLRRKEDRRLLTGRGRYTDDLELPRQTYARFVRSPYGHARIGTIDSEGALAVAGVLAVLTGRDFANSGLGPLQCGWMIHSKNGEPMRVGYRPALAADTVRYVGEAVAVVVASTRQAAAEGAETLILCDNEGQAHRLEELGPAKRLR